jgi:lysophospholipase L1-like esterase
MARIRWLKGLFLGAVWLLCTMGSSCEPDPEPLPLFSPLFVTDVKGLEAPKVSQAELFKPDIHVSIDPTVADAPQAAGFVLTIASAYPQQTAMRLNDHEAGTSRMLTRVSAPAAAFGGDLQVYMQALSAEAVDALRDGSGVFWLIDGTNAMGDLESRVAVLLPSDVLSSRMELDIYTDMGVSDTPVAGDRIELARGFLYMAVAGDSIMAGNGLPEEMLYSRMIRDEIEARTGLRVVLQDQALTGAHVVGVPGEPTCPQGCNRQLGVIFTSITTQVDLIAEPNVIDLVLINGCLNDISFRTIIDPATALDSIPEMADSFCRIEVEALLEKVRTLMPNATVVYTGYYPFISEESGLIALTDWAAILEEEPDQIELLEAGLAAVAARSNAFESSSRESLEAAVQATIAKEPDRAPRFVYVHPDFGPANALQASESLLWDLGPIQTGDLSLLDDFIPEQVQLFPQDPLFPWRLTACLEPQVVDDYVSCVYNTVGHPNAEGSMRIAEKIEAALGEVGFWESVSP